MEWLETHLRTIWVLLWTLGVIAFLVYFFRTWRRACLPAVLGTVTVVGLLVVQFAILEKLPGYTGFVSAAGRIGLPLVVGGVIAMIAALATGAISVIRDGKGARESDSTRAGTDSNRSALATPSGPLQSATDATVKHLYRRSGAIGMKSLVDGTATTRERAVAIAVVGMFVSLFLIFLGAGLMVLRQTVLGVPLAIVPGVWVYARLRPAWDDYRVAKAGLRERREEGSS
jgi:hypothetical protein